MDRNPYAPPETVASARDANQSEHYSYRASALIAVAVAFAAVIASEIVQYDGSVAVASDDAVV